MASYNSDVYDNRDKYFAYLRLSELVTPRKRMFSVKCNTVNWF
jgi:hypothetical protein